MAINKLIFILLTFFLTSNIIAQDTDSLGIPPDTLVMVDSIEIRGNDITEEFIILRELTFTAGDTVNTEIINYNKERVYSLGLFNFVELFFEKDSLHNTHNLIIDVAESWYIYPIPFINIRNTDLSQTTFGLNLLIKNFRGRNETIQAVIALGYDKFFLLSYINPVLIEDLDLQFLTSGLYQKPINKSMTAKYIYGDDFNYTLAMGIVSLGKRLNRYNEVFGIVGYSYTEMPSSALNPVMASNTDIDRSLILGATYIFDTRNLKQFAEEGIFAKVEYLNMGLNDERINYNILNIDFREYRPVLDFITAKWRIAYRHTFGENVPFYALSFFGYSEYIRGHRNDIREGNNFIKGSLEASIPIIKEWKFSIKLPLLPRKLTSTRIGMHLSGYVDTGVVYDNDDSILFDNFDSGWGFGITILFLPFNSLRFEYAFNEYGQGEFLIGSGFSF